MNNIIINLTFVKQIIFVYNFSVVEKTVAKMLTEKKLTLAVAESCTGGLISHSLTNIPGSSRYFLLGVIAYASKTKTRLLGVSSETIKAHGAVSKETALELAAGARRLAKANIGLSVTGIAGPTPETPFVPVGTVFIAVSFAHQTYFKKFKFSGNRLSIKSQAKDAALKLLRECLP